MNKNTCCFFGHRKIEITDKLEKELYNVIERLIVKENVDTFFFGSKSQFNDVCYKIVCRLKDQYPFVKRIYVRAEFPVINNEYKAYLSQKYEKTYYPAKIVGAGRSAYVERNHEMIDRSNFCIVYFDENYVPTDKKSLSERKSGTGIAYNYAIKKQKTIINVFGKYNKKDSH